jgi:hypothetical protein
VAPTRAAREPRNAALAGILPNRMMKILGQTDYPMTKQDLNAKPACNDETGDFH